MLKPIRASYLSTLDELFESNHKIHSNVGIEFIFKENPKFQQAKRDGRTTRSSFEIDKESGVLLTGTRLSECSAVNDFIKRYSLDGKNIKGGYLIPEKVTTMINVIKVAPAHPYIEKFQG